MTSQTDEFTFAEQQPAPPPRPRTPLPVSRRAWTWSVVAAALILGGVLASPGPIEPPRGEGVAWNVLDLDLTTEPTVTWKTGVELSNDSISLDLLGQSGGVVVVAQNRSARIEGAPPPSTPVLGLDAATGAVRLRIEDDDQTCQLGAEAVTCVTDRSTPDAAVVNYPTDGGESVAADHPGAMSACCWTTAGCW